MIIIYLVARTYTMETVLEIVNAIWPILGSAILIGGLIALVYQIKAIFS